MATTFPLLSRLLHWTMALLILAMLFIGVAMVSPLQITTGWWRSTGRLESCCWCWWGCA